MGALVLIKRIYEDYIHIQIWTSNTFKELFITNKEFNTLKNAVNNFEQEKKKHD